MKDKNKNTFSLDTLIIEERKAGTNRLSMEQNVLRVLLKRNWANGNYRKFSAGLRADVKTLKGRFEDIHGLDSGDVAWCSHVAQEIRRNLPGKWFRLGVGEAMNSGNQFLTQNLVTGFCAAVHATKSNFKKFRNVLRNVEDHSVVKDKKVATAIRGLTEKAEQYSGRNGPFRVLEAIDSMFQTLGNNPLATPKVILKVLKEVKNTENLHPSNLTHLLKNFAIHLNHFHKTIDYKAEELENDFSKAKSHARALDVLDAVRKRHGIRTLHIRAQFRNNEDNVPWHMREQLVH